MSDGGANDGGRPAGKRGKQPGEGQRAGRTVAEWTSLGISLAIVLALIGVVSYEHFTGRTRPAVIEVQPRLEALRREGDSYYLPVEIINRGDSTAEDVRVQLALSADQGRRQSSELRIDFLAGGETARGVVVFHDDPSRGSLSVEMLSFLQP